MDETKSDETNYFGSVEDNEFRFGVWKSQKFYALSNFVANFELEVNSDSGVLSGYVFSIIFHNGQVLGLVMHAQVT